MKEYRLGFILSFDQLAFQGLVLKIIEPNYWALLPEEIRDKILKLVQNYVPQLK